MFQQPPVRRAGEHDRQPPCLPPGAAVLLLDVAAVSGRRHCGQYRVAEANTHGLASDRGPHWSAVIRGAAHGYWPDMLLMHKPATSAAVSLAEAGESPGQSLIQVQHRAPAGRRPSRPAVRPVSCMMRAGVSPSRCASRSR